jgi:membrane protein YdbS with pleckstrin-like domain
MLITLEDRLLNVSSHLPKLPERVVGRLTKSAWMIALVVGILVLLDAFDIVSAATAFGGSCTGVLLGCVGGSALSSFYVAAALTAIYGVIYLWGVQPLRELRYRGWRIVFTGSLIQLGAGVVLTFFFGLNGIALVLIEVACGWYLLFSIRSSFVY